MALITPKENMDYDKIIENFDAKEDYKKAIRNHTNGDNIGAYVYLRRVIEKYINYIFKGNETSIPEEDFIRKKQWIKFLY